MQASRGVDQYPVHPHAALPGQVPPSTTTPPRMCWHGGTVLSCISTSSRWSSTLTSLSLYKPDSRGQVWPRPRGTSCLLPGVLPSHPGRLQLLAAGLPLLKFLHPLPHHSTRLPLLIILLLLPPLLLLPA